MSKSCVVLLSGGLDSLLALKLMSLQGIAATALHSVNCFHGAQSIEEKKRRLVKRAAELGAVDIVFPDITASVVHLTKHPRHGYGRHLNACIDCRLRTVREGFAAMEKIGADFVVSGEVIGQRPMSQRRDAMALADREVAAWGYEGRFLRPLSARLLPATLPEREGWVSADYLYDISGRGRERQMELAKELALGEYPTPAGGCLLTDPGFANRLAVLMTFKPAWDQDDVELLKVGRHFQISPGSRLVASRREEENYLLRKMSQPNDRLYINADQNGAVVMLRGQKTSRAEELACGLAVYYSKGRENGSARVESWRVENDRDVDQEEFRCEAVNPELLRGMEARLVGSDCLRSLRSGKRATA